MRRQSGFTAIEMVCSIVILGILAVCATVVLGYVGRGFSFTRAVVNDFVSAQQMQTLANKLSYVSAVTAIGTSTPNTVTCTLTYPGGTVQAGVTITAPTGFTFTYYDASGAATTTPGSVASIQIAATTTYAGLASQSFTTFTAPYQLQGTANFKGL